MARFPSDKDPDAVKPYVMNWDDFLTNESDTISTSVWLINDIHEDNWLAQGDGSLVIESKSNTTTRATIWLSGGVLDNDYEITNRITTVGGLTDDRTRTLRVRAQ